MSFSTKSGGDDSLNDSWVDVNCGDCSSEPQRKSTPISSLISSGKLERLLWEAQRESNPSSLGSAFSSSRESPRSPCSPQSPCSPKSPLEQCDLLIDVNDPCLREVPPLPMDAYLKRRQGSTDWIWDWSSRPDQSKPRDWKLHHGKYTKVGLSFRKSKVVKNGLFSSEVLSVLIVTNALSILVGAGIGLYISKQVGSSVFHLAKH